MDIETHENRKALDAELTSFILTKAIVDMQPPKPRMIDFSVSQLLELEKPYSVIRFDCAHGFLNVHRYYRSIHDRTDYPEQKPSMLLFHDCRRDILQNWPKYLDLYLKKHVLT